MKTFGSQIKSARLQRHLSQSALAQLVGCKQSALSMFECGRMTALNDQTIGKLCEVLGLLPPTASERSVAVVSEQPVLTRAFCPNPECPSNLPYHVNGMDVGVPRRLMVSEATCYCQWCGEILERACPECQAPIQQGAFCSQCGHAYVQLPEPVRRDVFDQRLQLVQWGE
ncbi:MAG: helix-turn-helix domain-containing protein [bacterium]|nr:helix-turn-helix domain-containing protein [bacterium]